MYCAFWLILERLFLLRAARRLPRLLRQCATFLLIVLSFCVFYFTDLGAMGTYFAALVGVGNPGLITPRAWAWVAGYLPLLLLCAVASTPLWANVDRRLERKPFWPWVRTVLGAILFLLCLWALASQSYNPFIYFRF